MNVLFAAAEAVPFVKTGGLADVMGALPQAVQEEGVNAALVIPKYSKIPDIYKDKMVHVYDGILDLAWRQQFFGVEKLDLDGLTVYFIDNMQYFNRENLYGYDDDVERFAFFCKAVLAMLPHIDFKPDIIHHNDWHTGMVGCYLRESFKHDDFYKDMQLVYTVHNLKYQGKFPKYIMSDVLGMPDYLFDNGTLECDGCVNFMKAGLVYADAVTTVSPSYAEEITFPYFGEKLDGYIRQIQNKVTGILNGLDVKTFNPATDNYLEAKYNTSDVFEKKYLDKEALQARLGLPVDRNIPVLAMVTRLVEDKGMDLLICILEELLRENVQVVIVGTGDPAYEQALRWYEEKRPTKMSVNIMFSEEMAHKVYGGADFFVMPSRFEACGLSQLIALRYGTIPIVREVGGLKDTITYFDKYTGKGNGLSFANFNAHELLYTIKTGISLYENPNLWKKLVLNAMEADFSWKQSAKAYKDLYGVVIRDNKARKAYFESVAAESKAKEEAMRTNGVENLTVEEVVVAAAEPKKKATGKKAPAKKPAPKKVAAKKAPAKKAASKKTAKKTEE